MRTALLVALCAVAAIGQTLQDDFSGYPQSSDAGPAWEPDSVVYEVADGGYVTSAGSSLWRAAPLGSETTFSCDLTVTAAVGRPEDWQVAGIGLFADRRNYWALNLVRSPEAQGGRLFVEMQESLNGTWLAQGQEGSRLKAIEARGQDYQWRVGTTYRFEIALRPDRIEGRVSEGDTIVAQFAYDLSGQTPAVRTGRPGLRASGLRTRYDNAQVDVLQTAPEPTMERTIPPWISRDAPQIADATGYFRTALVDGRWWLVDPEGKAFYDVGTDHCNYNAHWCETLGYAPHQRNMERKYGSPEKWAESATARLRQWNFNTLAAGHHPATRHRGLCHILFASFGSSFARLEWICEPIHWTGFPNVFSPRWERHCRIVARRIAEESKGDPWCIGTFLDNELEWYGKKGRLVDEIFRLAPDHTAKKALWDWLLEQYGNVAEINNTLGTEYADEQAFLTATEPPGPSEGLQEVSDGFLAVIAEEYFRVACTALREADPDHLVMGSRFAGRTPGPALAAAGRYNDVFTINTYPRVDLEAEVVRGVPRQFSDYYAVVQKPFIITEWSFPALDSGLPCKHGAGTRVDTQAQKAKCYRIFAEAMTDLPFMVGYHYFMWVDEPAQGISSTFPEDSNYGLVNVNDEPYTELVETATQVNGESFGRHAKSMASGDLELVLERGRPVVKNPGELTAVGRVVVGGAGGATATDLRLPAGEERRIEVPGRGLWNVVLTRWDGTVERLVGGQAGRRPLVANVGGAPLEGIPAVVDTDPPVPVMVQRLGPGETIDVAADQAPAEDARLPIKVVSEGVTWTCSGHAGDLFDTVTADGLALGHVAFAAHQVIGGQNQWVEADTLESVRRTSNAAGTVLDLVVARKGPSGAITAVDDQGRPAAQRTGPAAYRALVRVSVPNGLPVALVRPLWVESLDQRPWELAQAFVFCRPAIGGSDEGDRPGGPDVPNYYLPGAFWTDEELGGAFGAASPGPPWQVSFWTDPGGGFHPDARFEIKQQLRKGERWEAEAMPYLWVYALKTAANWRDMVGRCRASRWLLTAPIRGPQ